MAVNLTEKLRRYRDGFVANLEKGPYLGLFISRLTEVVASESQIELFMVEVEIFRVSDGCLMEVSGDYTIAWAPSFIRASALVEIGGKLSFYLPYIEAKMVFYPPDRPRPDQKAALKDLAAIRYI